jgi:transposase InsO family protein
LCWLCRVSRAGYYRRREARQPEGDEMELRSQIQAIALGRRHYGYRRVTAELRRRGRVVNHKRVARLMREDNLLAVRKRSFRPPTTGSHCCPAIVLRPTSNFNRVSGIGAHLSFFDLNFQARSHSPERRFPGRV